MQVAPFAARPAWTYFDHNATTPLDVRVAGAITNLLVDPMAQANPASVHRLGQRARSIVEQARRQIACALGADPLGVTFCSGGTEADNLAILGAARERRREGRPSGILTSTIDHPAVLQAAAALAKDGHFWLQVPANRRGEIDPQAWCDALQRHPELGVVVLFAAHHELGNRPDVPAITQALRASGRDLFIHCDAVQAFGKFPLDWTDLGVDSLALSAHKFYGPKGVGALVHNTFAKLEPLAFGGSQERGRRPGTPDVPSIAGMGLAAELAQRELDQRALHLVHLRNHLAQGLLEVPGVAIQGDATANQSNTVMATFQGCEGELLLMALDLEHFAVSTGAACSSGTVSASATLRALGLPVALARSALRFSLGKDNTSQDVARLLAILPTVVDRVQRAGTLAYEGGVAS